MPSCRDRNQQVDVEQGRLERWSPVTGIAFAILFVIGGAFYDRVPSIDASDEAIVAYYTDSDNQLALQIASLVLTLAAVLFIWFVGALAARLRSAEGESSWLSRIVVVSGAASVAVMVVGFLAEGMVIDIGDDTKAFSVDPDTTRLLTDATYTFIFETALPLAAPMVIAASLVFLRTRLLPRWLGWAGVAVGFLCLVGFLGVPMGLYLLWIVIVAIYLVRRPATGDRQRA